MYLLPANSNAKCYMIKDGEKSYRMTEPCPSTKKKKSMTKHGEKLYRKDKTLPQYCKKVPTSQMQDVL